MTDIEVIDFLSSIVEDIELNEQALYYLEVDMDTLMNIEYFSENFGIVIVSHYETEYGYNVEFEKIEELNDSIANKLINDINNKQIKKNEKIIEDELNTLQEAIEGVLRGDRVIPNYFIKLDTNDVKMELDKYNISILEMPNNDNEGCFIVRSDKDDK